MNPNNPRKCPEKTRDRQITWPLNHSPNPDCNEPLIEHDSSECNCDKCIYRLGLWARDVLMLNHTLPGVLYNFYNTVVGETLTGQTLTGFWDFSRNFLKKEE